MDNCEVLMLEYLNFCKGVIDSRDLPPNISDEMLQLNEILKVIREDIARRCVELIEEVAADVDGVREHVDGIEEHEGHTLQHETVPVIKDELLIQSEVHNLVYPFGVAVG